MDLSRRKLIGGLFLAAAAPAIVRASSLMPVKALKPEMVPLLVSQNGEVLVWFNSHVRFNFIAPVVVKDAQAARRYLSAA
jgi:hypothetical protein